MMDTKMNRLDAIKLAAVGGSAAFIGGKFLGDVADAWAMNPRFDLVLHLTSAGTVIASGPSGFASDERRAMVTAYVAQGDRVQIGHTGWFSGATWSQVLTGPVLKKGAADAYGVAYVQNKDGSYEWYPWEVAVTLK